MRKPGTPEAFDRAASLSLDAVEEAFGIVAINGRSETHASIVAVLDHYTIAKSPKPASLSDPATGPTCEAKG